MYKVYEKYYQLLELYAAKKYEIDFEIAEFIIENRLLPLMAMRGFELTGIAYKYCLKMGYKPTAEEFAGVLAGMPNIVSPDDVRGIKLPDELLFGMYLVNSDFLFLLKHFKVLERLSAEQWIELFRYSPKSAEDVEIISILRKLPEAELAYVVEENPTLHTALHSALYPALHTALHPTLHRVLLEESVAGFDENSIRQFSENSTLIRA